MDFKMIAENIPSYNHIVLYPVHGQPVHAKVLWK